jgi:hypothetical protein
MWGFMQVINVNLKTSRLSYLSYEQKVFNFNITISNKIPTQDAATHYKLYNHQSPLIIFTFLSL